MSPGEPSWPRRWSARPRPATGTKPRGTPSAYFLGARAAKDRGALPDAAWRGDFQTRSCRPSASGWRRAEAKAGDMTSVMTERDGAGQTLPAPAVPDLT